MSKTDKLAIEKAKNTLVSIFDRQLPKISLEQFLKRETNDGPIAWEVNDCGEQTGNPAVDRGRDFPTCVQATADLRDHRQLVIFVAVGTVKEGISGAPELGSVTLSDAQGVHEVRLQDLPAQLHPAPPSK